MWNTKLILALVAVLAMAGTTFADLNITIELTDTFDGAPYDLEVYTVNVQGAKTFGSIAIDGLVHQVNEEFNDVLKTSIYADDIVFSANAKYDTHFLLSTSDVVVTHQSALVETNNNSNPAGLAGHNNPVYVYLDIDNPDKVNKYFGLGIFSGAGPQEGMSDDVGITLEGTAAADALGQYGCDFMQVVILAGTEVTLMGTYGNDEVFSQTIGELVPEPSAILMLLVGSLCLFGVRFRKY